jgi:hypothetical protein
MRTIQKNLLIAGISFCVIATSCKKDEIKPTPTTDHLVSYYQFDGTGKDETGFSNATVKNGTYIIDPSFSSNMVLSFDGTGYVDTNTGFDYPSRSISIWFKASSITTYATNIFVCNYENNLYGSTTIGLQEIGGLPKLQLCLSEYSHYHQITDNVWYNAVIVQNGMDYFFYLDGILVDNGTLPGYYNSDIGYQNSVIGANRYFDRKMTGYVAEVRLYDKALSAEEIQVIYSYSSPR